MLIDVEVMITIRDRSSTMRRKPWRRVRLDLDPSRGNKRFHASLNPRSYKRSTFVSRKTEDFNPRAITKKIAERVPVSFKVVVRCTMIRGF